MKTKTKVLAYGGITGLLTASLFVTGIYTKNDKLTKIGLLLLLVGAFLVSFAIMVAKSTEQDQKNEKQKAQLNDAKKQMKDIENAQSKIQSIKEETTKSSVPLPDSSDGAAIRDRLNRLSDPGASK